MHEEFVMLALFPYDWLIRISKDRQVFRSILFLVTPVAHWNEKTMIVIDYDHIEWRDK